MGTPKHISDELRAGDRLYELQQQSRVAARDAQTKRRLEQYYATRDSIEATRRDLGLAPRDLLPEERDPVPPGLVPLSQATQSAATIPPAMVGVVAALKSALGCSQPQAEAEARKRYPTLFPSVARASAPPAPQPEADGLLLLDMRVRAARRNGQPFDQFKFESEDLPRCNVASALIFGEAFKIQGQYHARGLSIDLIDAVNALRRTRPELFDALRPRDASTRAVAQ
jgi:hypothetical protein